jgi:hypothetical protein
VLLFSAGSARADTNAVGILSIETTGVSKTVAGQFEEEVEESLSGSDLRTIDRETMRERLSESDYIEGCTFGPCLSVLRAATGVPLVLVARIDRVGSSYTFVITLLDTKTGMFTSQVAQPCEVCTIEEAIGTATLATIALINGTGGAEVSEFSSSAASTTDLSSFRKSKPLKGTIRRTGLIFLGAGIVAGGLATYFWTQDKESATFASGATGAAFITSGATMLLLSRRF